MHMRIYTDIKKYTTWTESVCVQVKLCPTQNPPNIAALLQLPGFGLFFREHSENEAVILVRLEGRGN